FGFGGSTVIHRRQFLMGLTGALVVPRIVAQSLGVTKLNDGLSLLTGVGTNVLALSTNEAMVLVDSGDPQSGPQLMASVSRVRTVFNTHYHLENTGSNEALSRAG